MTNALFASAYALVQRTPEFIFDGPTRVAEYDVLTETAGVDLGVPFGTTGELRGGLKWVHYRGDPTIADNQFPTIKSSETGARFLFRWPFYVAWGLASGGQRSFYLYLGRL